MPRPPRAPHSRPWQRDRPAAGCGAPPRPRPARGRRPRPAAHVPVAAVRHRRARGRARRPPTTTPPYLLLGPIMSGLAAPLFDEMDAVDPHAFLDGLHHVVERQ